jgi:hypothetical protein
MTKIRVHTEEQETRGSSAALLLESVASDLLFRCESEDRITELLGEDKSTELKQVRQRALDNRLGSA